MEQWTLIKTIITQLQFLISPPKAIRPIHQSLFEQAARWRILPERMVDDEEDEDQECWELLITQAMNNPKFPELEILRYACVAFDMKIIALRGLCRG